MNPRQRLGDLFHQEPGAEGCFHAGLALCPPFLSPTPSLQPSDRCCHHQIPVTIYLDPGVAVAGGVPWWVILLAVLAGILVLALLIFILWKVSDGVRSGCVPSLRQRVLRLYCAMLCHPTWAVLCYFGHAVPCHAMSRHAFGPTVPCRATLCHAVPCHAVGSLWCHSTWCHAVLFPPSWLCPSSPSHFPPQCGFFKRSSPTSRYTANYYRARRGLQPSEVDKQALQGQR